MNDIKLIWIVVFSIIGTSTNAKDLNCSQGSSIESYDKRLENSDSAENMSCFPDDHYCDAIICTKVGSHGFSAIYWGCAAEYMVDDVGYLGLKATLKEKFGASFKCWRLYGEKDQNMGNLKFTRPPVPNGLMCLKGEMDAKGNGAITRGLCTDEEHYCFKARCAKDNGEWKMKCGCSTVAGNCDFVSAKRDDDKCLCLFGEKDIDFANENLTIEIPTVMTTPILTTLTTKETTTTTTTTTTTVTTEEPTKPMTTSTLELAQSTINEGNGVRASNGVHCYLKIIAIACAVQALIVAAQQFNAL